MPSEATGQRPVQSQRLTRAQRLRRRPEFLRVQRNGRRIHTRHFVVVVLPRREPGAIGRIGITVTKKVAGAVGRNHAKRVVREVYRKNRQIFPDHCDIVLIAKSGAHALRYDDVLAELARIQRPMWGAAKRARASSEVMEFAR